VRPDRGRRQSKPLRAPPASEWEVHRRLRCPVAVTRRAPPADERAVRAGVEAHFGGGRIEVKRSQSLARKVLDLVHLYRERMLGEHEIETGSLPLRFRTSSVSSPPSAK